MLKIAFILQAFYGDHIGGAERQVQMLAEALREDNWETAYICERTSDKPAHERVAGMQVFALPMRKKRSAWKNKRLLCRAMDESRADIFYQRIRHPYTGLGAAHAKKLGKPFIFAAASKADVVRDKDLRQKSQSNSIQDSLFRPLNRHLEDEGILTASARILQTSEQLELLKRHYRCSGVIIPNHVVIRDDLARQQEGPLQVIWISNIKAFKRPELFIQLAENCADIDAEFIMIGSCVSPQILKDIKEAEDRIEKFSYIGPMDPVEAEKRISQASVLVNTSEFEGFPNAFQQAWIYGVPTVSLGVDPDGVISREKLGSCVSSLKDMENEVRCLLNDASLRSEIGDKAQKFSRQEYDIKQLLPKYLALFHDLLKQ
ncbi:hypothetical protein CEE37_02995 [candidate division LCP-89 bacterium B3_LCP]|uniref:Glycosyltransferase subfamily 4-like N-terminal domain-containing protein n=1 Tax=candidate division LCP-89 bacterium B3_LCP TaxID=2012998 RepID=A0A532V2V9_UNCL8|nr:MAG: hypothetical protein CEE37_02995 [candidate division LCP-89 bacterium B3_LCP]